MRLHSCLRDMKKNPVPYVRVACTSKIDALTRKNVCVCERIIQGDFVFVSFNAITLQYHCTSTSFHLV